ncbi:MAG: hypothetical protein ABJA37_11680 [Ferruginibacter sp.]
MKQAVNYVQGILPATTEVFFDNVTKEKIRKHLSDFNDVITEEDIKNIKTDMTCIPLVSLPE